MDTHETDNNTLVQLNKNEINQAISTAKQYPRDIKNFGSKLTQLAAASERTAVKCMYAIPRDGKMIEGPSARFAEMAASLYGNCRSGSRVVSTEGDMVTAQGVFHDLENNNSITFEVQRPIVGKNGQRFSPDMIRVTGNAACSIALRNAILKGIPSTFWEESYEQVRQAAMGDAGQLEQRRDKAVKFFGMMNVSEDDICRTLKVDQITDIDQEKLMQLHGIATAIKDGDTTAQEAFGLGNGAATQSSKTEDVNQNIRGNNDQQSASNTPDTPAEETPPEKTADVGGDDSTPPPAPGSAGFDVHQIERLAKEADSKAGLEEAMEICNNNLGGDEHARVSKIISDRMDAMEINL